MRISIDVGLQSGALSSKPTTHAGEIRINSLERLLFSRRERDISSPRIRGFRVVRVSWYVEFSLAE